ncbi:MAG: tRNA (adenosine(37)-N6)-threonylcarbamoyltransferase complex dimerization subunit type 1 TsaB [Deltaproteobacteria bacterium]|nr:tRNA (adenosine(37)-N6)-threonylcarbamoyltransferase complex dimerization subunit type 1 TsaB [Deltaproteobacteria bacterium]
MITLAVDTSVTTGVALLKDDDIRAELSVRTGRNHAETLLPAIEGGLASGGIGKEQIDLFAVAVGPGSFTGLRVGVSTVKGLAFVLQKPVIGVCTLDALVLNIAYTGRQIIVCPMLDAGRGEIYTALYRISGPDTHEKMFGERIVRPDEFLDSLGGDIVFLGDGAEKYRDRIDKILPVRSSVAPSRFNQVRAAAVGLAGRKKFLGGDLSDVMTLVPYYLRSSYAAGDE